MATSGWNIPGENPLATGLRAASQYVETAHPISILTEPGQSAPNAFALGPAVFASDATRLVPYYAAFEAVEAVKIALDNGDVGKIYGCFGSFRLPRGSSAEVVELSALLPIVAVALDLLPQPVTSAFAKRASLFAGNDAWFVTLRLADETIVSLEALASSEPATGRELLIEVTGSDRVLRAEPFRQSVFIEPLDAAPVAQSWWEDPMERFLRLVASRATQPSGTEIPRLRAVWKALLASADTGERIMLS
jgi:predicted dehydrogenase